MIDTLTDIPLPGRIFASNAAAPHAPAMPAFVAGPENRLLASTVDRFLRLATPLDPAAQPDDLSVPALAVPPPFPRIVALFGATGTGKTHLALGLVNHWRAQRGDQAALYLTATDFRRAYTAALSEGTIDAFRTSHRSRSLLAIDGLHQLPANDALMEELCNTIDAYDESGGILLVTSSRPATTLAKLPVAIRSRIAAGLMVHVAAPGTAARLRILHQAASALGRVVSDDAATRIAAGRKPATEIFNALFDLCNASSQAPAPSPAAPLALSRILATVARHAGLSQKLLKSKSRKHSVVRARALVIFLARQYSDASYEAIGRALGGRDHTTIMHSFQKIRAEKHRDPALQETIEQLRQLLRC